MYHTGKYSPKEIKKKKGESHANLCCRVLNNFFFYFPGPNGYREGLQSRGQWKTPFREFISPDLRSDKRLDQTPEQFYTEIDATVAEIGMELEDVSAFLCRFFAEGGTSNDEDDARFEELWKTLSPIYVALRKKGYTSQDVTG